MYDDISGWQDWTEAFVDWHDVSISELHGWMTGVLTVCDAPKAEIWQQLLELLSFSMLDDKPLMVLTETAEDVAATLGDVDDSYQFMPLLPDDEHPLYERLLAIKDWANGFLTGFGITGSQLRPEEQGLFQDLAKIGALNVDILDEHLQDQHNVEGETDYMQLLEFVRMVPVSVSMGRPKRAVQSLSIIAGFPMNHQFKTKEPIIEADDELAWEQEKQANDEFLTNMVLNASPKDLFK